VGALRPPIEIGGYNACPDITSGMLYVMRSFSKFHLYEITKRHKIYPIFDIIPFATTPINPLHPNGLTSLFGLVFGLHRGFLGRIRASPIGIAYRLNGNRLRMQFLVTVFNPHGGDSQFSFLHWRDDELIG